MIWRKETQETAAVGVHGVQNFILCDCWAILCCALHLAFAGICSFLKFPGSYEPQRIEEPKFAQHCTWVRYSITQYDVVLLCTIRNTEYLVHSKHIQRLVRLHSTSGPLKCSLERATHFFLKRRFRHTFYSKSAKCTVNRARTKQRKWSGKAHPLYLFNNTFIINLHVIYLII
jgi:hypothetical protein